MRLRPAPRQPQAWRPGFAALLQDAPARAKFNPSAAIFTWSDDSRQPVEQNGQAESRSDPKNRATRPTPSPSSTLHKLELFSLYRRTLFASPLALLQMTSASLDARRTVVDVDVLQHRPTFYVPPGSQPSATHIALAPSFSFHPSPEPEPHHHSDS